MLAAMLGLSAGLRGQPSLPVEAVSVANPGTSLPAGGSGDSGGVVLSADGRWAAFSSTAANLVTNRHQGQVLDLYLRDRQSGVTTLISGSLDGATGGDGDSAGLSFSPEGRFLLFESQARNLVTNETTGAGDIYLRDLTQGVTTLISVNPLGQGGNGPSTAARMTPDTRFVVFQSQASDLAVGDTNGLTDVFVRDRARGTTALVSVNWQGTAAATPPSSLVTLDTSVAPVISADGRYVAFQSWATNLVLGDVASTNFWPTPMWEVYVRDLVAGTNQLVSLEPTGAPATNGAVNPLLSADGRYVVYENGVLSAWPGTFQPLQAIYRRDLWSGATLLVSPPPAGMTNNTSPPVMSTNGAVIAYANNNEVWVWQEAGQTTSLLSTNVEGQPAAGDSDTPVIADDGSRVAFLSNAPDLIPGVTNGAIQVVFHRLDGGTNQLASGSPSAPTGSTADCLGPTLSADGQVVAFTAADGNLVADDNNRAIDVFARDLNAPGVEMLSVHDPALNSMMATGDSTLARHGLSANGRYVLFTSTARELAPDNSQGWAQVFLRDTVLQTNILVSVGWDGFASGRGGSHAPAMTPDGRFVVFLSMATNLVATNANPLGNVYVRDVLKGATTPMPPPPAALGSPPPPVASSLAPVISPDGRFVAYDVGAGTVALVLVDLQAGSSTWVRPTDSNSVHGWPLALTGDGALWYSNYGAGGLYRRDPQTGATQVIVLPSPGSVNMVERAFTPDGRFVVYGLQRGPLPTLSFEFLRYEVSTQSQHLLFGASGAIRGGSAALSADGRFVVFVAPSLTGTGATAGAASQVYLLDAQAVGRAVLVTVNAAGTGPANGVSDRPDLSADGRFITFRSTATDLLPGMAWADAVPRIYVRDQATGQVWVVGAEPNDAGNTGYALGSWLSADGSAVALGTTASDLVAGDYSHLLEVFFAPIPPVPPLAVRLLPVVGGAAPVLGWTTVSGGSYQVQFKNQLADPVWQPVPGQPVSVGTNQMSLTDTTLNGSRQRFYRVVRLP